MTAQTTAPSPASSPPPQPALRRGPSGAKRLVAALPWITPAALLIGLIVLFPAGFMIWTSTRDISQSGVDRGAAGLDNFRRVFEFASLDRVLLNTALWTVGIVLVTVLVSLGLAQFLDKSFPGRRLVRLAVIVPWAASVVMTSTVFAYGLDPFYGIINRFLVDIGLLETGFGFTRQPLPAFLTAMAIAVFVSLPFTTYTLLAGLATIPEDILEAAQVDGAGPWRRYTSIILPSLRPALAVAVLINIINVFNSLPILRVIAGSIPGYSSDTTTTLIFKFIQTDRQVDTAAALSVVNFAIVLVVIGVYLRVVRPMQES